MPPKQLQVTHHALMLLTLLLATHLRLGNLSIPGLWLDEISYSIAAQRPIINQITNPTETLGDYLSVDPTLSAIPFSLALKLGSSNFFIRFPAAIFGILSVAMIYRLGRRFFGPPPALVAALLLCSSSFHILYSQEGRSYTQFVFFSMASFLFLLLAINRPHWSHWLIYGLATWAAVSTNHLMLFTISVQGLGLVAIFGYRIWITQNHTITIRQSIKLSAIFLLVVAIVYLFRIPWYEDFTQRQCAGCAIGQPSYNLRLFYPGIRSIQAFTFGNSWMTALVILLGLAGLSLTWRTFPEQTLLIGTWLLFSIIVTIVGLWAISQFFHPRYTIWGLPAFLLAAACGIERISRLLSERLSQANPRALSQYQGLIATLLVIPLIMVNLFQAQNNPDHKRGWPLGQVQDAAIFIAETADKNDTIISIGLDSKFTRMFINRERQDLEYLDELSFVSQKTSDALPEEILGRWYVINNRGPIIKVPTNWKYRQFGDITVIGNQDKCEINDCIQETFSLLQQLVDSNPDTKLAEHVSQLLDGLANFN